MTTLSPISLHTNALDIEGLDLAELRSRLREAEDTLFAIRNGDVDAVVVGGPAGQKVYTLENADRPYRVLIEQMQEGAVTLSEDGTVLYCNDRLAALLGVSREALLGEPIHRFFEATEAEAFKRLLRQVLTGVRTAGEFSLLAPQGDAVPVNISLVDLQVEPDMPQVVCGVVTDLTHSRRRSHELAGANAHLAREIEERRHAEDSLQLALDAAGMGSWDLDLIGGTARRTLRHDQIFGFETMVDVWRLDTALEYFLPADRAAVVGAFADAQQIGTLEFEQRIKRSGDGEIRWVQVKGRTHYDQGRAVRITGVISDVTEHRRVEDQLRQAQKMEAVGQLTGGIAHDFNNLLMVISGSLDLLSRRVAIDANTARLFDVARQGVARGSKLNQQLLAFSRRQDLQIETVCLLDLIPGFEHLLERAVSETVSLEIEHAPTMWFCKTDPHQLETAILNLVINSRDAMPHGGTVRLVSENKVVSAAQAHAWGANPGEYVVVSVADTGEGMSEDLLARVFEPFFTTKPVGKGTGLGLSQVYGFAKQSGGFVSIESKSGQGTVVRIHLPRVQAPKPQTGSTVRPSLEVHGQGIVMVVEDDADVRKTTCFMLEDLGYVVLEAETGRAALGMIEAGAVVDLVFTDVIMPDGISGIDLARELAVRRPTLPVLLTSGYTAQQLLPQSMAQGLRLLRKPYAQVELSRAIRDAMTDQ